MSVPDNQRTEFSTSTVNTSHNLVEEQNKENYYVDSAYIPEQDARAVNVVSKIKEGIPYIKVGDDSTEEDELKAAIRDLDSRCNSSDNTLFTMQQTETSLANSITALQQADTLLTNNLSALGPKRVYKVSDFIADPSTAISTESLYDTFKTSLELGDVVVGNIKLTDGPTTDTESFGLLAYTTHDNITDGDNVYSRVYMIISSKQSTYSVWWLNNNRGWESIMLLSSNNKHFTMSSSTEGSTKKFWISVDDSGTLSAVEVVPA